MLVLCIAGDFLLQMILKKGFDARREMGTGPVGQTDPFVYSKKSPVRMADNQARGPNPIALK
jgi:hypothetical protein